MSLNLADPKVAVIHGALMEVLGKHDVTKIKDYFTDDVVMIINEKKLQGPEVSHRVNWVKNQTRAIKIQLHNAFFDGDQGFDHHTTEIVDNNGKRSLFKIFGHIKLRDGKICRYEDVTIQLEGENTMEAVTSIQN